jgi:hypothetical protein
VPINLTISGESAHEFLVEARRLLAGLVPLDMAHVGALPRMDAAAFGEHRIIDRPLAGDQPLRPEDTMLPTSFAPGDPDRPAQTEVATPVLEAPKRGRGRPRAEPKPATFTVRRYGGMTEGEYTDSGQAAELLIELIQQAADEQALDELMQHNAEDMLTWPKERQTEVMESADAVRAVLKSGEPEPPAPTKQRVHNDLDGNPLSAIDVATIPGVRAALNAFCAQDDGTPQGPFYQKARAHMDTLGIVTVGKLDPAKPDDAAKLNALGTWCAEGLGLPVAGSLL